MQLLFSNPVFSEDIIRALSRTLMHSLWQGMLLAMIAGGIVIFTRRAAPAIRYNLLTAALLVFVLGVVATFSMVYIKTPLVNTALEITGPGMAGGAVLEATAEAEHKLSLAASATGVFNRNAGWVVSAWLLIIVWKCFHFTFGLYRVYQLKISQTFLPGDYWSNRLVELRRQLQINKKARLLQSRIAKVPAVIGYFKPVILFPAAMLASLPPDEVEAILIHELAHIRRRDFLINLLQHITEIIFFFNPAVRWVSSLIRLERENCCDEIAVNQTDNKRNYINALISFQGFDLPLKPIPANAFGVDRNHLINRVKRIIYKNNKTLNNMEKKFLAAGMVITSLFIFAFSSNNSHPKKPVNYIATQNAHVPVVQKMLPAAAKAINDTVPASKKKKNEANGTISTSVDGKKYKIVTKNDQVVELYVDGKKIPAEEIGNYKPATDKILAQKKLEIEQSKIEMEQSQNELEQVQHEMELSKVELEVSEKEMAQSKLEMDNARADMANEMNQAKEEMEQTKIEMELQQIEMVKEYNRVINEQSTIFSKQSKKEMQQAKMEMEQVKKEMDANMKLSKIEMEQAKKEMAEHMKQSKLDMERAKKEMAINDKQSKIEMERVKKDMEQARKDMEGSHKEMNESKKLQDGIVEDFIKEKIIKDKKDLSSFKLSNEVLIVNGVKQPSATHKRFKDKYVKSYNNWTMEHSYNKSHKREVK